MTVLTVVAMWIVAGVAVSLLLGVALRRRRRAVEIEWEHLRRARDRAASAGRSYVQAWGDRRQVRGDRRRQMRDTPDRRQSGRPEALGG